MSDLPHAESNFTGAELIGDGAQRRIPPHTVDVPMLGKVTMYHADGINLGTVAVDHGDERLMIQMAMGTCDCGCNRAGIGLFVTPPVEHARALGEQLIAMADVAERNAIAQADALIARARGK